MYTEMQIRWDLEEHHDPRPYTLSGLECATDFAEWSRLTGFALPHVDNPDALRDYLRDA